MNKGGHRLTTNNAIINKLFTQNMFKDLLNHRTPPALTQVAQQYIPSPEALSYGEILSQMYQIMSQSYRNEYFFQNTLLMKLLLGKHSIHTTTALTQVPIGNSIADFVLINGKAVVYEIKTELDTFNRLRGQLEDYYKAFDHVCVVTSESGFSKLKSELADTPVGIYVLNKQNRLSNKIKKDPIRDASSVNHSSLFSLLRKKEYESILFAYYGELPSATPVFYYDASYARFAEIPLDEAYVRVLNELKKRNRVEEYNISEIPDSLKSLAYFANISTKERLLLCEYLSQQFRG
ncbi:MAG: sce7726 family protein [Spirochaetaceae bacterium]|nr:sce7726 family protein [Spirochaetaceae bacterium]